jgi:hypothetical protein
MTMAARNQYLHALIRERGGYHLRSRKEKARILDEYCRVTGQNRDAVSRKIRTGAYVHTLRKENGTALKRTRSSPYTKEVTRYLIQLWEIFDRPCGKRLTPMIRVELDRLRRFGELQISDEMATILKKVSSRSIDTKLKDHKEKERLRRVYAPKRHPLLYQKIPIKVSSEQGRGIGATTQIDLVEHCGQTTDGLFLYSLSITDIGSGWWEGEPILGKHAKHIADGLGRIEYRFPFPWKEIHSDNGSEFINALVWRYAKQHELDLSRSRPYMKNDNCFVEQKNGTHIRKMVGYHRYDTKAEQEILKNLYRGSLRQYKNFFQPIIPLISKERIGGHLKRKYGEPKTPYQRILNDRNISSEIKDQLRKEYQSLNPAALKRAVKAYQDALYQAYKKKQGKQQEAAHRKVNHLKKLTPRSATFLIAEPKAVGQHSLIA